MLITFDPYYSIREYNDFLNNIKKSAVPFKEYVCIKAPYHFYFDIAESHLPVFLKYQVAPKGLDKYMLEKVQAFFPNEEFLLKRKDSDSPTQFERFVSPRIFINIKNNPYACIFRYKNKEQLIKMSKELGIPIWVLGKQREWNLAFSYNSFIKNYIHLDWILVEKTKPSDYQNPGEFEQELNYKKLVKTKLTNKYLNYPYYENGIYYPLKLTH